MLYVKIVGTQLLLSTLLKHFLIRKCWRLRWWYIPRGLAAFLPAARYEHH